jgi:hypothetical protein
MNPAIAAVPTTDSRLLLSAYFYLQILDLMTTTVFLAIGIQEANPLLRFFMGFGSPLMGLAVGKMLAIMLGLYCWKAQRYRILMRGTWFFGLLVMWNLFAMIVRAYGGQ